MIDFHAHAESQASRQRYADYVEARGKFEPRVIAREETRMDQFRAVMMSKYDEGCAYVRDFITKSNDDDLCGYAEKLIAGMKSENPGVCLGSHLSVLGLFHVWLSVLEGESEATS